MTSMPSGRTSIPSSVGADVDSSQQLDPHSSRPATPKLPDIVRIGLTKVWGPSDETKIDADVCFVHGLGGHPFTTWQYKTREEKRSAISRAMKHLKRGGKGEGKGETMEGAHTDSRSTCYWPFDLLQKDFDNIRILTYGYDSSPTHWYVGGSNQMTIDQHTQTLLQKISDQRTSCAGRPIIFVAHSLGGILVKNLIIESCIYANLDGNSELYDIYSSCHAIVFFGTPHRGANSAELGYMVANAVSVLPGGPGVYKGILRNLRPDSEKLVSIIRDFNDILTLNAPASEKIQIYSFQEGKGYAGINIFDHKVVPDGSSILNIGRAIERSSFIPNNHMDMCRFKSCTDSGYVDFKAALSFYEAAIKEKKKSKEPPVLQTGVEETIAQDLINSLDFQERVMRKQQLAEIRAKEETFEWIWTSEFKTWLESSSPLFWISGKPASGKSTLMEHLSSSRTALNLLRSSKNEEWTLIYHFFDFRAGDRVRNNFYGFLRSLVVQLCLKFPECKRQVALHFKDSAWDKQVKHWLSAELHSALDLAIQAASSPILLLVDGLDEFEGDEFQLCQVIRKIASPQLKVCVASRPDPPYPDAFRDVSNIRMDRLNEAGIFSFTKDTLMEFWRPKDTAHRQKLVELTGEITVRAKGVFLWACFAVKEVLYGQTRGEGPEELQERLDGVPDELKDIYTRIFGRMTPAEKQFTSRVLLIVFYAKKTFTIQQMFVAMSINSTSQSVPLPKSPNYAEFRKKMLASSGGILETFGQEQRQEAVEMISEQMVHIIHRTVEFHLQKCGWVDLGVDGTDLVRPHYYMIRVCSEILHEKYFELETGSDTCMSIHDPPNSSTSFVGKHEISTKMEDASLPEIIYQQAMRKRYSGDITFDLLDYAILHLLDHAWGFEQETNISSYGLLHNTLSDAYVYAHFRWEHDLCAWCNYFCRDEQVVPKSYVDPPLYLAMCHELTLFVKESLGPENSTIWKHLKPQVPTDLQQGPFLGIINTRSNPSEVAKAVGLVAVAVNAASKFGCTDLLESCLAFDSFVEDKVFRRALIKSPLSVVRILVEQGRTASGDFTSQSNVDYSTYYDLDEKLERFCDFGPLWDVAKRTELVDTEGIIDLLLQRGEDINGICGPAGTAVFSLLGHQPFIPDYLRVSAFESHLFSSRALNLFVRKGANINADGPDGTPLEFFWELINSHKHLHDDKVIKSCRETLLRLIELGGVNKKRDPDGHIPSVEEMLSWGADEDCQDG